MEFQKLEPEKSKLEELAAEKIKFGEVLLNSTEDFAQVEGLQKIQRKINQELKFLRKVLKNHCIKKEHLQCSNLTHFAALLQTLREVRKCISLNKIFLLDDRKIAVDIICDDGLTWIKVIARNPKSLSQICMGDSSFGVRSILDQAEEYVECAKLYPCLFQTPKVVFTFANGIGINLASKLEAYGVIVQGKRLLDVDIETFIQEEFDDAKEENNHSFSMVNSRNEINYEIIDTNKVAPESFKYSISASDLTTKNISHIRKVNLDVSAMLAYCSSVTNGSASLYDFCAAVLAQQAKWEMERPQKPILDNFFKDKKLYCCETAMDNFINIVNTVGGPSEQERAAEFMKRITVLPDDATVEHTSEVEDESDVFKNVQFTPDKSLTVGGKIRERSLKVFSFGDRIQAVTVTANDGFVRAARQQGINFVVFVHESRALTEQKEQTRAVIKQSVTEN